MRSISSAHRALLYAAQMSSMLPVLLRIDYTGGSLYFVNNTEDIVYNGNTYTACAFKFNPPDQAESGVTNASLTIDAVDGTILAIIRALNTAPAVTTVAAMYNSTVESIVEWTFILRNVSCDGVTITGDLIYEERLDNGMGPLEFTPQNAPAIF